MRKDLVSSTKALYGSTACNLTADISAKGEQWKFPPFSGLSEV